MITYRQRFFALAAAFSTTIAIAQTGPGAETPPLEQELLQDVLVGHAGFILDHSARVRFSEEVLADGSGGGVLVIRGEDLVIDLTDAVLRGAVPGAAPDTYTGIGIRLEGARITLTGGAISGFKIGIDARGVDGLVIEGADVSDNFRQRLASTPEKEDLSDWLSPHHNDDGQWIENYGAGIHIRSATGVTVRDCIAHNVQNGLILDRVQDSFVYDNDFSFLSGWGIAMWRSNRNMISRNSLEFCIRGYSHGIYNRGQDSAGLLMFEQCNNNVIADNSITHGGDGIFSFGGSEALGDTPAPEGFAHKGKGCNDNLFVKNDLAYAAAHGLEITFSFNNQIFACRFVDNAISGIWAGYTQGTAIVESIFQNNGGGAYGLERGGINIEHGRNNAIIFCRFQKNPVGVRLWWDADEHLAQKPWVLANGANCGRTVLYGNEHRRDGIGLDIDGCPNVTVQRNKYAGCEIEIQTTEDKEPQPENAIFGKPSLPEYDGKGKRNAIGLRAHLQGRRNIIMTEWGPFDFQSPRLVRGDNKKDTHIWRMLGAPEGETPTLELESLGEVEAVASIRKVPNGHQIKVQYTGEGLLAYRLSVKAGGQTLVVQEQALVTAWSVRAFASKVDPREDLETWRAAAAEGIAFETSALDFPCESGGLADLPGLAKVKGLAEIGSDAFGLIAETSISLPAGSFSIRTNSDDGIRVMVDGQAVIEDWTHHGATEHTATLVFEEAGQHEIEVEWFELDGAAQLTVELSSDSR